MLFGTGEVASCRAVAQSTGILLDPIYTLAAWDASQALLSGEDLAGFRDARPGEEQQRYQSEAATEAGASGGGDVAGDGGVAGAGAGASAVGRALAACSVGGGCSGVVVMLHTGGTLGLFGLAQSSSKLAAEMLGGAGPCAPAAHTGTRRSRGAGK